MTGTATALAGGARAHILRCWANQAFSFLNCHRAQLPQGCQRGFPNLLRLSQGNKMSTSTSPAPLWALWDMPSLQAAYYSGSPLSHPPAENIDCSQLQVLSIPAHLRGTGCYPPVPSFADMSLSYSSSHPRCLAQCGEATKGVINIWWMNEWLDSTCRENQPFLN